ncbi:MAG: hypothetical protein WC869_14805, partial [Phycisphaerae bacterium]
MLRRILPVIGDILPKRVALEPQVACFRSEIKALSGMVFRLFIASPHISHWVLRAYIEGRGVWADGFVVVARQIGADYPLT